MRTVVVFDTNILISGIGWRGAPYHCLELAINGKVEGITWSELLQELMDKLTVKLKFSQQQVIDTLETLFSIVTKALNLNRKAPPLSIK